MSDDYVSRRGVSVVNKMRERYLAIGTITDKIITNKNASDL